MASSSSIDPVYWNWPEDLPGAWDKDHVKEEIKPQPFQNESKFDNPTQHSSDEEDHQTPPPSPPSSSTASAGQQQRERHYNPRTCRICLETVLPTYHPPSDSLPAFLRSKPNVTYEDADGGRLLRPCLCKGSQKYVHEHCLQAWRLQNPAAKQRMNWAHWISSTAAQILLTLAIFIVASFTLGYVADPIINLYLDPYDTIAHGSQPLLPADEPVTWTEHFVKGFASLGLVGFAKFLLTLSPWQMYNMRTSVGGRNTGRDRMAQISWIAVSVGILTFTWAVWKGVRAWSRRALAAASERVMDVPGADDEDDDE
ncbi:hypothetical protein E4T52_04333 [Aureobasidium sp. EXF-3400]|nr:hypothetical protein E4T51_06021 [Aureobasidium sp. EXF-12344]KAI4780737.1 hypothetical protein E4T52_04333 [Aureobasidium sp. EXF-3400]